jgi:D-alanyl-D-alanine carboxypeptidase
MIIEQVTGNPWTQEVTDRIIEPLGLEHTTTGVGQGPQLPDPHAKSYQQFAPGGPLADVTVLEPSQAGPSGSVISTTGDLTRIYDALLSGELLAPEQLAQMQATVPTQDDGFQGYGLGLAKLSLSCGEHWAHGGDNLGSMTVAVFAGDGSRGIVISVSSLHLDEDPAGRQQAAFWQAIDNALCATT